MGLSQIRPQDINIIIHIKEDILIFCSVKGPETKGEREQGDRRRAVRGRSESDEFARVRNPASPPASRSGGGLTPHPDLGLENTPSQDGEGREAN